MKLYDCLTEELQSWIERQHVFFVATAPLSADGHVNLSPKGYDSLRILDNHTVCYMDMAGSGNETSAHIQENGRMTLMFCAFEGGPRILRLYGRGKVLIPSSSSSSSNSALDFETLVHNHYGDTHLPGTRQLMVLHIDRIQTSCGYGVPYMDFKSDRNTLHNYFQNKGQDGCEQYIRGSDRVSIDSLPTPLGKKFNQEENEKETGRPGPR